MQDVLRRMPCCRATADFEIARTLDGGTKPERGKKAKPAENRSLLPDTDQIARELTENLSENPEMILDCTGPKPVLGQVLNNYKAE